MPLLATLLGLSLLASGCVHVQVERTPSSATLADAPMPAANQFVVRVGGQTEVFDAARMAALSREACVVEEGDRTVTYEGVRLGEVIRSCGVPQGKELRKAWMSQCALVRASDGYRVAFALPELDPAFTNTPVLLADRVDGAPINDSDGPFKIIVPNETRRARWVRGVIEISIEQVGSAPGGK